MSVIRALTNPILNKELRIRMRSKRSPWAISLYLLTLGGIAFAFIFLQLGNDAYFNPQRAKELFMMLSVLQFALISFVTPGITAGVISGERERQTLSLLLTTNSSPTKIILGKWLSSLSFMAFLVLASIPLYSIIFLFGGISPEQLVKLFPFYLIAMFAIGSVGVLFSTLFKRTGVATVVTYGVIFAFTAATFIGAQFIESTMWRNHYGGPAPKAPFILEFLHSINPVFAIMQVFNEGPMRYFGPNAVSSLPFSPYYVFLSFYGVIAIIALLLAIFFLKPVKPRLLPRFRKA